MQWDAKQIRARAWGTVFGRGLRGWFTLVVVCFLFAFIGASSSSQASFVDAFDRLTGSSEVLQPHNTEVLYSYAESIPWVRDLPYRESVLLRDALNAMTESSTWVIRLLALNPRYFADNPGEVLANVVIVALVTLLLRFCVQNVAVVGMRRYVMESRQRREVPWRRMLAPFHLNTLGNVVRVTVCYHLTILLWALTIVGGIYKAYQYAMVPYLLAENPRITWREAKALSARMTDGYKMKMFLTQASYAPLLVLELVPVVGLLVSVPVYAALGAEFYTTLRANTARSDDELARTAFIERAFDAPPYAELAPEEQRVADETEPAYLLENLDLERPHVGEGPLPYPVVDLIYCFFVFCFIGWVWEVGLHFVQFHEFVNRGTLHGPWIPIYGVGGAGIILLLDRYKANPEHLFGLAVGLCAVLEYATSFILDFMFNSSYWNYDGMMFNVNGRICLAGLLAFGIGGLVGVYIAAPAISRAVYRMPARTRNVGAVCLVAAFASDLGYCLLNGFNGGSGVGEDL